MAACYPVCYAVRTNDECRHAHGLVKSAIAINTWISVAALVFLCSSRLLEDGTPVPKHVGDDTYHELYFTISILMCVFVG